MIRKLNIFFLLNSTIYMYIILHMYLSTTIIQAKLIFTKNETYRNAVSNIQHISTSIPIVVITQSPPFFKAITVSNAIYAYANLCGAPCMPSHALVL